MRVAFLGLGIMGHAMATNLVKAGHDVTVWNRTPGKQVEGARSAANPREAANGAEVVWMCVSDTDAVESMLFGGEGVESSLREGMIIADSSTISPAATAKFAERVLAKGVSYVDAPMTGSKVGAQNGTLVFIVGGDQASIERLKPRFSDSWPAWSPGLYWSRPCEKSSFPWQQKTVLSVSLFVSRLPTKKSGVHFARP